MVEMLGVLAIIGILSVGSIAGYSNALEKIKSNKRKEQYNQIFYQIELLRDHIIKSTSNFNPAAIWNKTNSIPAGLYYSTTGHLSTKPGNTNSNGALFFRINLGNSQGTLEMDFYVDKRSYDKRVCTDFIEVVQNYKDFIHPTYCLQLRDYGSDTKEQSRTSICPKNMPITPAKIDEYCSRYSKQYRFAILLYFQF